MHTLRRTFFREDMVVVFELPRMLGSRANDVVR